MFNNAELGLKKQNIKLDPEGNLEIGIFTA